MGGNGEPIAIEGEFNLFVKDAKLANQFISPKLSPKVRKIVRVAAVLYAQASRPAIITEILRDDEGPHGDGRACDLRSLNLPEPVAANLRDVINRWFPYGGDGAHETVPPLDHKGNFSKSTAAHVHIQVRTF